MNDDNNINKNDNNNNISKNDSNNSSKNHSNDIRDNNNPLSSTIPSSLSPRSNRQQMKYIMTSFCCHSGFH